VNFFRLVFRLLMGRRLPITRGTLTVPGLHGRARIHRDRHGIPMIEADDPRDGPFTLGFCQAQDRSFQLEMLLRIARGTVSEMAGPAALPIDRLSRRIGFHNAARQQWPLLADDVRDSLEAYAQGVQAGRLLGTPLAHEFSLVRSQPTPWTALDTLAITKLLSFTLCSNWDTELVRLKVLSADGPEALAALDSTYPAWQPVTTPAGARAGQAVDRLAEDLKVFFSLIRPGGGSNGWVLAPSRTTSGRPLLANDPHLDAVLPAHWYLVSLRTSNQALAGASFVGGPVILVGHNGHACWGITAGLIDNTDLFLEEIGPDETSVREGDRFIPCEVREEVIAIKGARPVTERVLVTPRGPIVSPMVGELQALSLRASWLDAAPMEGFFRLPRASTFAEFRQAFAHWPASAQNLHYADTSGTIGWQLIGRAPVRRKGHGSLPLPGWSPEVGWQPDPIPFEQMPHLENPECGWIATANNPPLPAGQEPFLGLDFVDGYRAAAIHQALARSEKWDVATTMRLQMDQHALAWQEMREIILAAPLDPASLSLLRDWDGNVSADSEAAAVYELFLAEMSQRVARAKAPNSWRWLLGASLSAVNAFNFGCFRRTSYLVELLRDQPAGWFSRSWPEEIADAVSHATEQARAGLDSIQPWGRLRPLVLQHPLARRGGRLGQMMASLFNLGPVPCGGDCDVINQAAAQPLAPLASSHNVVSLRAVFDVGAWANSRFVLPGGQSGNPFSPHYGDLFELWQRGEGVPIAFAPDEVRASTIETLELLPG
jgi:penicillin amidase